MPCYLHSLPEAVLDELMKFAFDSSPFLRLTFLASLGSHLHDSAARVLFKTLSIVDDQSTIDLCSRVATCAIIANPERYAQIVKTVIVHNSDMPIGRGLEETDNRTHYAQRNTVVPLNTSNIYSLLEICINLEGLVWESAFPPPEGLCEVLMSKNLRLSRLAYAPRNQPSLPRSNVAKWNALSLPLLMYLPITTLHLSGLSQSGVRALSSLLSNLGQGSTLEDLNINFVWLDDFLCEKIVEAGRKLRKLSLSTSGTKLSDRGLVSILEECEALEVLALVEIQGRLSRQLWEKPQNYPPSLRHLQIVVNEAGPHHSWTTDHLNSLHAIPLEKLLSLSVIRHEAHPHLENGILSYEAHCNDDLALDPAPTKLVEKMRDGRSLITFECDFWTWPIADIKVVLSSCPNLQAMKISLDFAFSKLSSLSSIFVSLSDLRRLSVCVNRPHAPGMPPRLLHPWIRNPTQSPVEMSDLKSKYVLSRLLDYNQMQTQTCVPKPTNDPSMPLLRDVKRFVRKLPRVVHLDWYGKAGRGTWVVTRRTTSKFGANISIAYQEPSVTHDVWESVVKKHKLAMNEKFARSYSWTEVERLGHLWTGEAAEALAKEAERSGFLISPVEYPRKLKELTRRKTKVEPMSPSSSDSLSIPSLSEISPSLSPVSSSFPLTPLHSEHSIDYDTIATDSDPRFSKIYARKQTGTHKQSPSEPPSRITVSLKGRTQNTTATSWKDIHSEHRGSPMQLTTTTVLTGGPKCVRGKGRNSGRNRRHLSTPDDGTPPDFGRGHRSSISTRGKKPVNTA